MQSTARLGFSGTIKSLLFSENNLKNSFGPSNEMHYQILPFYKLEEVKWLFFFLSNPVLFKCFKPAWISLASQHVAFPGLSDGTAVKCD